MTLPAGKDQKSDDEEFSYLPAPRDASMYKEEGLKEKFLRKTKENPFVPIGRKCPLSVLSLSLSFSLSISLVLLLDTVTDLDRELVR